MTRTIERRHGHRLARGIAAITVCGAGAAYEFAEHAPVFGMIVTLTGIIALTLILSSRRRS